MISVETAGVVVDTLDRAREWAVELAMPYNLHKAVPEAKLIADLRTVADKFGLEIVPKSDREQDENIWKWNPPKIDRIGGSMSIELSQQKGVNPKDAIGVAKVPMGYFPPAALLYGALGLWNGDVKYDKYNWREGGKVLASIYIDAVERHLGLWKSGEEIDPKSGVPHLGHVMAGLAILIDAFEGDYLTDDRPRNQYNFGDLLDKWNAQGPALVARWKEERRKREVPAH